MSLGRCSYCGKEKPLQKARNSKIRFCVDCRFHYHQLRLLPQLLRDRTVASVAETLKEHGIHVLPYLTEGPNGQFSLSGSLFYANDCLCKLSVLEKPFSSRGWRLHKRELLIHLDRSESENPNRGIRRIFC